MSNLFINYENYKGGTNNLCVVMDLKGNYATSTKGKTQALINYCKNVLRGEKENGK